MINGRSTLVLARMVDTNAQAIVLDKDRPQNTPEKFCDRLLIDEIAPHECQERIDNQNVWCVLFAKLIYLT